MNTLTPRRSGQRNGRYTTISLPRFGEGCGRARREPRGGVVVRIGHGRAGPRRGGRRRVRGGDGGRRGGGAGLHAPGPVAAPADPGGDARRARCSAPWPRRPCRGSWCSTVPSCRPCWACWGSPPWPPSAWWWWRRRPWPATSPGSRPPCGASSRASATCAPTWSGWMSWATWPGPVDELAHRLARLEQERAGFDAQRTAMLSSVSHDLRTPIAALRAAAGGAGRRDRPRSRPLPALDAA